MANLRQLMDGKGIDIKSQSDVFNHLKKTKDAKTNYDLAKMKLHQKLAPAKLMMNLIDKEHPMDEQGQTNQDGQQVDQNRNPIQQQQPGMQTNPNNPRQQNNQNMQKQPMQQPKQKTAMPNNKAKNDATKKSANNKSRQDAKNGGLSVHIKASDDSSRIDRMNVRKKKKMKANDYHDNPGFSEGAGRGMGLSSTAMPMNRGGGSMGRISSPSIHISNPNLSRTVRATKPDPNKQKASQYIKTKLGEKTTTPDSAIKNRFKPKQGTNYVKDSTSPDKIIRKRLDPVKAGGPGSGRKPEWSHNDTKGLDRLHRSVANGGYKYSHSNGEGTDFEHGSIRHVYYKGSGDSKTKAVIIERPNGRHSVSSDTELNYAK